MKRGKDFAYIYEDTKRKAKVMAAKKGKTMVQYFDEVISKDIEDAKESTRKEGEGLRRDSGKDFFNF